MFMSSSAVRLVRTLPFLVYMSLTLFSTSVLAVDAPTDVRGTAISNSQIKWEWSPVPGVLRYSITVDGLYRGETTEPFFVSNNLWYGEHSMSVKSVRTNTDYSQASKTVKVSVGSVTTSAAVSSTRSVDNDDPGMIDPESYNYPEVNEKSGYELVFSDEFNGTALNEARWNTQLRWDGDFNGVRYEYRTVNGEDQFYVNIFSDDQEHLDTVASRYNPFELDGSRLAIRAARNPLKTVDGKRTFGSLQEMSSQQTFLSGALSSHDKFSATYGYYEARIKIPSEIGTFPAFWLFHQRRAAEGTQRTEIDIMENLGHAPWYIYNSFHYFKNVSPTYGGDANFVKPEPQGQIYTGIDYSEDYHVYAVEWEPGKVKWLIDGEVVSELSNTEVDHEPLYLILNLAIGGNWTNFPESAGGTGRQSYERYPTQEDVNQFGNPALEIDYVRVYRRP